jgi:hypothetical protein
VGGGGGRGMGGAQYGTLTLVVSTLTDADCESDATQKGKNLLTRTGRLSPFILFM